MASEWDEGKLSVHGLNSLRHAVLEQLGRHWADWDAEMPGDRTQSAWNPAADSCSGTLLPVRVYLDGVRSPFNVGSIMRTALAFGSERVWCSPGTPSPRNRRALRSAMGAADILRWETESLENLSRQDTGVLFALELGGTPLENFRFPSSGTIILGSEELGVSPEVLKLAGKDGGVVSIPLPGPKVSLNVGVAFGIVLRQWILSIG
jgi:TrmH family RNA methyltransferase